VAAIFDFHTHLGTGKLPAEWNADALVRLLDKYMVEQAVVMPWDDAPGQNPSANDEVADAMRRYPDRLVAFARIHPKDGKGALAEMTRAVEQLGLRGLKLHPLSTATRLDDPVSLELVRMAAAHGLPVYYHSGDDPSTQPVMFNLVINAVPEATIVLGHAGGYFFWRDAAELAARHPNVYLSTTGSTSPSSLAQLVKICGTKKILFGSDSPAMHTLVELAKVNALSLTDAESNEILFENAHTVL
jgi:predicted TIM-barrel fold metal-dependent hydrolase